MENRIHFISGLPRAGSTLLAAVLRQNPDFHAAMTSPVGSLYMAMESAMSRRNETSVFLDAAQRRALLRGVFAGYYHAADPATVIFDTNRLWCARLAGIGGAIPIGENHLLRASDLMDYRQHRASDEPQPLRVIRCVRL